MNKITLIGGAYDGKEIEIRSRRSIHAGLTMDVLPKPSKVYSPNGSVDVVNLGALVIRRDHYKPYSVEFLKQLRIFFALSTVPIETLDPLQCWQKGIPYSHLPPN